MDYIIAGLGNPGSQYAFTRHNTGWLFLDHLAEKTGIETKRLKFRATCGEGVIAGKKVLVLRPQTFMNLSGDSVREAAVFYKVPADHIIVVCDDVAQPCGQLRIRKSGSDGGHKGLRSIIEQLGTDAFIRIRVGVSAKPDQMDMADWVVGGFSKEDSEKVMKRFDDIFQGITDIISGDIEKAMALCNRRTND